MMGLSRQISLKKKRFFFKVVNIDVKLHKQPKDATMMRIVTNVCIVIMWILIVWNVTPGHRIGGEQSLPVSPNPTMFLHQQYWSSVSRGERHSKNHLKA